MVTSKQLLIEQFIDAHPFQQVSTTALALTLNISLPTVLSYIKNHPDRFTKVKHGWYQICPTYQVPSDEIADGAVATPVSTVTVVSAGADHQHPPVQVVETQLIASWQDPQLGTVAITVTPLNNNSVTEVANANPGNYILDGDLIYYPSAPIPFPKNTSITHNTADLEQSDLLDDSHDVELSNRNAPPAPRPFDW